MRCAVALSLDRQAFIAILDSGEGASRPVLLHSRFAGCKQSRVKDLVTMTNSRFNGWRLEDVWLDR